MSGASTLLKIVWWLTCAAVAFVLGLLIVLLVIAAVSL